MPSHPHSLLEPQLFTLYQSAWVQPIIGEELGFGEGRVVSQDWLSIELERELAS